jgi:hypothetical protein
MARQPLTLDFVRGLLAPNKSRLDDELELQPDMYDRISSVVTTKTSRMLEAKEELARVEGRVLEDIREGDAKITVDVANGRMRRHPERVRAWQAFQDAREALESWQGLLEAWKQKGYSIKTLSELYSAQYFGVTPNNISNRQRSRMDDTDGLRADMRAAGRRNQQEEPELPRRRAA